MLNAAVLYVQLFKGGIRYQSGGATSGFHHHEEAPHKATLAQIKVRYDIGTEQAAGIPCRDIHPAFERAKVVQA